MALKLSESPSVAIKEIDLSGVVPAVTSTTGALVGDFNWGPADLAVRIGNEAELASTFGSPSLEGGAPATDFLSAAYFLKYSSNAYVSRAINDSDVNAVAASTATQVKNLDHWNSVSSGLAAQKIVAKYPGSVGNSLSVEICPAAAFTGWDYETDFDTAPAAGEVHIAVVDSDGVISGTAGSLLETFAFASTTVGAKTLDGTANHVTDVLNNQSQWVWASAIDSVGSSVLSYPLSLGARSSSRVVGDYVTAFDVYEDVDTIQVDFLIAPSRGSLSDATTITNALVTTAVTRQDCVVVASPDRTAVFASDPTAQIVTTANTFTASSYLVADNNFVKVYNKYEDKYEFIAAASSTAGVMAATDDVSAPWFSPAGARRGQYLGVTSLAFSPTKSQRDTLYRAAVNPIVNLPGQGIILFGDKTKLGRPSAFDRINVRRLFLIMERAIKAAGENVMFEFNDEFTRAEFVNIVEPFLREIKGRRGISDFRVVCDETNNTADVIDNNSFVASIFVKPARSINYVTLNFVATRTGVDFEEVVGIV